ncbi:FecR family protein [Sphingobacterium gobiense]|nr:FecR domain-containing protein [Sphingobacterium gobiense]
MDRITYLVEKFWRGEATEKEKKEILRYLEQHKPEWRSRMEQAFFADEPSEDDLGVERAEHVFAQIESITHIKEKTPITRIHRIRPYVRIAVAIIVLMLFGWGMSVYLMDSRPKQMMVSTSIPKLDTIVHRNLNQEDLILRLEDGSKVFLTSGSSITYLSHFDVNKREVFLDGKATFDVAKDTLRPFTVWADGYSTTALGTTFSVSAYHTKVFKVNLISGKVVVRSSSKSPVTLSDVYLEPGEELRVNPLSGRWAVSDKKLLPTPLANKQVPRRKKEEISEASEDTLLVFDKTPLNEVFHRISRQFDVKIDLSGVDVSQLSFTGDFHPTDSLDVVVSIICNMNDLMYHEEKRTIRIEKINK